jgi:iron complex outermembrane recepter protein
MRSSGRVAASLSCSRTWFFASAASGVITLTMCAAAAAQESSSDHAAELEEVIVAAQRRSQNLQDVPISALVTSGEQLGLRNNNALNELTQTVPAVYIGTDGRSMDLYIRGIGAGSNQSLDQSVSIFEDDVYHGRSRMTAATFLDTNRVEILMGPQGTFFGNNAIAGAVNIVTNQPTRDFQASARVLYGSFDQYAADAAVGGGLTDQLSARLALTATGNYGWLHNINVGEQWPIEHNLAGRLSFRYAPSGDFDATLKAEAARNNDVGLNGSFQQVRDCPPQPPFHITGICASSVIPLNLPVGANNNFEAFPNGSRFELTNQEYVLTANFRHWGHTFTSVTAFTGYDWAIDIPAQPGLNNSTPTFTIHAPERYSQFSQELRVASLTNQPIEYIAGGYFQSDHLHVNQDENLSFVPLPPPLAPLGYASSFGQGETSTAVFGSATWHATDRLSISIGARQSWVDKNYNYNSFFGNATHTYGGIVALPGASCTASSLASGLQAIASTLGIGAACTFNGDRGDHAFMPSANIRYNFAPAVMGYLSYSRGFLAGGFNGVDTTGVQANIPYNPEYVNAYEVGLKSKWLDNSLLVNVAIFRSDYSDLQVTAQEVTPGGSVIGLVKNAASARSQGVEFQTAWAITRQFRLSADVTYLHARYESYPNGQLTDLGLFCHTPGNASNPYCIGAFGGDPGRSQNLSGKPTAYAPDWSVTVNASYTKTLPGGVQFTADVMPYITGWYYLPGSGANGPEELQPGYVRWDARLSLASANGKWAFDVIGKNLSNKVILTTLADLPLSLGSYIVGREMPRNFAGQVRYTW